MQNRTEAQCYEIEARTGYCAGKLRDSVWGPCGLTKMSGKIRPSSQICKNQHKYKGFYSIPGLLNLFSFVRCERSIAYFFVRNILPPSHSIHTQFTLLLYKLELRRHLRDVSCYPARMRSRFSDISV